MVKAKTLNWIEVGISLVTLHYGLGFLIGSGESIYANGPEGILYALATAAGLFSLLVITKYYWKNKFPIWTLMGKKYGKTVKETISFLSCVWMIGVVASQVQGGSAVFRTIGIPPAVSIIIMTLTITLLSLLKLQKLVKFFFFMLLLSSLSLLLILAFLGVPSLTTLVASLSKDLATISFGQSFGIIVPTILVTFIGMDFHQFLTKARTENEALKGVLLGGFLLVIISLILLALTQKALEQNMLYNLKEPLQAIPLILNNFGSGISPVFGIVLLMPIIFVAIGSGSGVNRIVQQSMTDSKILPLFLTKKPNVFILVFIFVLVASFSGDSVVDLIVAFYAIYVGSVLIPFLAFLLDMHYKLGLSKKIMIFAIATSVLSTLVVYAYSFFPGTLISDNKATYMLIFGFIISIIVILIGNRRNLLRKLQLQSAIKSRTSRLLAKRH